jgi:hypothetical protein
MTNQSRFGGGLGQGIRQLVEEVQEVTCRAFSQTCPVSLRVEEDQSMRSSWCK